MTAHTIEFRVRYSETDQMGFVYHANYLVWCEMGRTEFIRDRTGRGYAELERDGVGLAVVDATVRYHAAARYDDLIRVSTTVREVKSRTITFDYAISRAEDGVSLASVSTTLIALSPGGAVTSLPTEVRAALENDAG